ncbi:unnamed protein product [Sphagnum balticum]
MTRPTFCLAGSSDQLRSSNSSDEVLVVSSSPKRRHWQQVRSGSGLIFERRADTCIRGSGGSGSLELLQPPAYRIRRPSRLSPVTRPRSLCIDCDFCWPREADTGLRGWETSGDTRRAGQSGENCRS